MKNKVLVLCALIAASFSLEAGHHAQVEKSFLDKLKCKFSSWFEKKPQTKAEKIADLKKQIQATNKKLDDIDRKEDELDRKEDQLKEKRKKLKHELAELQDQKPKKAAPKKEEPTKSCCSKPVTKKPHETTKKPAVKVAPKKAIAKK